MIYTMHDALGDAVEVQTLERAYEVCAEFVQATRIGLDNIETATDSEDRAFAIFDLIGKNWDHNVAVIERMKADPEITLARKKAEYREMGRSILGMAGDCVPKQPPTE